MDYILIYNIPIHDLRSKHLRHFFESAINNNIIKCFHFIHRPTTILCGERLNLLTNFTTNRTSFSIIKLNKAHFNKFRRLYHEKKWHKLNEPLDEKCYLFKINLCAITNCVYDNCNLTLPNCKINIDHLNEINLNSLPELNPPSIMPNGNVGTPINYFLKEIQLCNMPPSVIKRLGLSFPKTRRQRQYGEVHWQYNRNYKYDSSRNTQFKKIFKKSCNNFRSVRNDFEQMSYTRNSNKQDEKKIDEELEEWDRHEALYDDPSNQNRNKERLYEEPIEVVWEKGGPGIVWHTDALFWDNQVDEDEKDVDEWEVDFSEYIEQGSGDKDAQDMADIRQVHGEFKTFKNYNGVRHLHSSNNNKYISNYGGSNNTLLDEHFDNIFNFKKFKLNSNVSNSGSNIGEFEKFSKGIGSKILSKYGWVEGKGLGAKNGGMVYALENEGQKPGDNRGFGYRGEKLPGMFCLNHKIC